jgi:hypothetical protein
VYDSCGAGDWCTVGFLFYLEKLASKDDLSLVKALKSVDILNRVLKFAQVLSALSCGFIGARGLSNFLKSEVVMKVAHSHIKNNKNIIAINRKYLSKKIML